LTRKLLFAKIAVATRDLERCYDTIAFLYFCDSIANLIDNTAELMTQDITFLELDDSAM
jgi:hypothetical protein